MQPSISPQPDRLLTVKDVAVIVGCHTNTVKRHIRRGYLPIIRVGGMVRIQRDALAVYLRNHSAPIRTT